MIDGFREIMKEYQVEEYRACATSAFRAVENPIIILEQVYRKTGIQIEILSGSEQHFLGYKSIAAIEAGFKKIIQKGTAIVDVGGGNTQVSLFDKDTLVTTQNLRIGSLRIRERLRELEKETTHYDRLVEEFIRNELLVFQRLYLKERNIQNVILLGDFLQDIIFREELADRIITKEEFSHRYEQIVHKTADSLAMEMNIPSEYATLVVPMVVIYKNIIDIWERKRFGRQVSAWQMELPMITVRNTKSLSQSTILKMIYWCQPEISESVIPAGKVIFRVPRV